VKRVDGVIVMADWCDPAPHTSGAYSEPAIHARDEPSVGQPLPATSTVSHAVPEHVLTESDPPVREPAPISKTNTCRATVGAATVEPLGPGHTAEASVTFPGSTTAPAAAAVDPVTTPTYGGPAAPVAAETETHAAIGSAAPQPEDGDGVGVCVAAAVADADGEGDTLGVGGTKEEVRDAVMVLDAVRDGVDPNDSVLEAVADGEGVLLGVGDADGVNGAYAAVSKKPPVALSFPSSRTYM